MTKADIIKFSTKKPFEKYDNYNAIEVSFVKNIPGDYDGVMGVPISFLDKYNPDQFIRCEKGTGTAIVNGHEHAINDGFVVLVPAGAKHNIINTSADAEMKLYTLYAPPNHKDGVIHKTKAAAEADEEHFDGVTTE